MANKEIPAYIETSPGRFVLNPEYVKAQETEVKKDKAPAKAKSEKPKTKK